jgi:hypothetical protein
MNAKEYLELTSDLIPEIKRLASEYYKGVKRPLGITGEIAEYENKKRFGYDPADARSKGHDTIRVVIKKQEMNEIKSRVIQPDALPGQRFSRIKENPECVAVIYWFSSMKIIMLLR